MKEDIEKLKIEKTESGFKKLRIKRNLYYIIGLILTTILIIWLLITGKLTPSLSVEVTTVKQIYPSQAITILNASGYVVAQRKASVASKITGLLTSINVEEGSKVKAGEIIARLENEDVLAEIKRAEANLIASRFNLEQAKAELTDATLTYNRNKELIDKGYISKAEFDSSEARYNKALAGVSQAEANVKANEAQLQSAKVAYEYTLIRAPFDAIVLTKNADVGDIVTPIGAAADAKAAVVTIADMNSLQVEADVSESNIYMIKIGQPCEIQLDALPEKRFRGKVHMIVPTVDRTKATLMVKISFIDNDPRILPDMSAKVSFLSKELDDKENTPLLAINKDALVYEQGKSYVFVIQKNKAIKKEIITGREFADLTEVKKGISAGETIIVGPLNKVKNGRRVKVIEK